MADEFAQQWSLGDHEFHLSGHPDAYYFTGERLIGEIMFCPKNDCKLRSVTLHLFGRIAFQTEGKFHRSTLKAALHPAMWFQNKAFLHESVNLFDGFAARDEPQIWPFKFDIPTDVPSSTEEDIHPSVKYNLRIDFVSGKISRISYRHPLKILTKITKRSPLFPLLAPDNEGWKEIAAFGDTLFRFKLEKIIYDSTERIILCYEFDANISKLRAHFVAHLVRETKVCFAAYTKTLASVDIDITDSDSCSDVVICKGEGLVLPSLQYEKNDPPIKIEPKHKDVILALTNWDVYDTMKYQRLRDFQQFIKHDQNREYPFRLQNVFTESDIVDPSQLSQFDELGRQRFNPWSG